jgi:2-polyprenyl-3-methyl-5-hydroxy-6-metoxy-1,4-benzoquinol methylase
MRKKVERNLYDKYNSTKMVNITSHYETLTSNMLSGFNKLYGSFLPKDLKNPILELGCGDGTFLRYLKKKGYLNCTGIDISPEMTQIAIQRGLTNIHTIDFFEYLEQHQTQFSLIVMRDVIEHLDKEDCLALLELCRQRLTNSGAILIQTCNGESILSGRIRYGDITHVTSFTSSSLDQLFYLTGFIKPIYRPVRPQPVAVISSIRYILWLFMECCLRLFNLIETGSSSLIATQTIIGYAKKDAETNEQP